MVRLCALVSPWVELFRRRMLLLIVSVQFSEAGCCVIARLLMFLYCVMAVGRVMFMLASGEVPVFVSVTV